MTSSESETATVELTFYATFRDAVGQKTVARDLPAGATLGDALADAAEEYPDLRGEILAADGGLCDGVRALRNGDEGVGVDAPLEDGDEVSFVMPIHGG